MFSVYCSISNTEVNRDGKLQEVVDIIDNFSREHNHLYPVVLNYRPSNEDFDPNYVNQADVVLIMHHENKFEFEINSLHVTVRKDFELAKELGKKVFLLYRTKDGKLYTYNMSSGNYLIGGTAGTTEWFKHHLTKNVPNKKKVVAQIGKTPEVDWSVIPAYDLIPPPQKTEYIKTSGIVKPMYDRRLLI